MVRIRTCQTWPNRWFVHAATADGHQNNDPPHLPDVPTVFNLFEYAGNENWKIYFHDLAQAHTLLQLFLLGSHFHPYRQFQADCLTGQLPAYSFIEPQYYADLVNPENDQHPPSVVTLGEQLIADVYNCLRSSRCLDQNARLLRRRQISLSIRPSRRPAVAAAVVGLRAAAASAFHKPTWKRAGSCRRARRAPTKPAPCLTAQAEFHGPGLSEQVRRTEWRVRDTTQRYP
ncbi:MAG: alkaline phosphatase family protein [Xanthobacteraceae bacterium]